MQWSSSNEIVGTIGENGNFSAKRIGETYITTKVGRKAFTAKVTVEPYVTDIIEPVLKYGVYSETIRNEETREFISEDASQVRFMGQGERENRFYYNLRNGVVDNSVIVFNENERITDDLRKFFGERYELLEDRGDRLTYLNRETNIGVTLSSSFGLGIQATWITGSYKVTTLESK